MQPVALVVRRAYLEHVIVWLAVALWVVIVVWSLALMRVASTNDRERRHRAEPKEAAPRVLPELGPNREKHLMILWSVVLAGSIAAIVLLSTEEQWSDYDLVGLIAALVLGSELPHAPREAVPHLGLVPGLRARDGASRSRARRGDRHCLRVS